MNRNVIIVGPAFGTFLAFALAFGWRGAAKDAKGRGLREEVAA